MNTVNVIQINGDDGLITSLVAFVETPEGNTTAEQLFKAVVKESTDLSDAEIEVAVENGYCDVPGGASIQLVHSTDPTELVKPPEPPEPFESRDRWPAGRPAAARPPQCDMDNDCNDPVTHIDVKGFIYCEHHGVTRRNTHRCRKLRQHELNRLKKGLPVKRY